MAHHTLYRKKWEDAFGPIPVDADGRSYEIHHIDGDRENNDILNLMCVSIAEHYEIHKYQKDYTAAMAVFRRMNKTPKEISEQCSKLSRARMADPETKEFYAELTKNRWATDEEYANKMRNLLAESSRNRVKNGTHNFMQPDAVKENVQRLTENCKQRVKQGTHNFLTKEAAIASSQRAKERNAIEYTCPHCGKQGKGAVMKRHHFDRCKLVVDSASGNAS
jgi:hypothetical protein